jgi:ribosomal protein S18 acetylase RimI-like enzyme
MIKFRKATQNDASLIADLVNSAYRGDYAKQGWTTEADILDGQRTDAEALLEVIHTPLNQIEIAFEETSPLIIGCVHLIKELPDTLYFGMLTVEPTSQARGLGKSILEHIERIAREEGFMRIRLTVIPTRAELIAFYQRRGYTETGRFEPFPTDDPRFGIPKVSHLVLKEFEKKLSI